MIERYSADAVRYWAASTGFGKDALISEEKIKNGGKLINKLWNVARFSERFLADYRPARQDYELTPADNWLLARLANLIERATALLRDGEYATAKSEIEAFFWRDLADNYLEMCKERLYNEIGPLHEGARYTLYHTLLTMLKLFAPFLPYVTEEVYRNLFAASEGPVSLHLTRWPQADPAWSDTRAEEGGDLLLAVATAVRRFKSETGLALGSELARLLISTRDIQQALLLEAAGLDLLSVTRARELRVGAGIDFNGAREIARLEGVMIIGLA
jgi:valyl-tRNA synthetase